MNRRLPALTLLGWLLAGCGISGSEPFAYGEPLNGGADGTHLYFALDHRVYPVLRPATTDLLLQDRLDLLVAGPTDTERAAGLTTALPPGARLSYEAAPPVTRRVRVRVDGATLDGLDDTATMQIACTVVASPGPPALDDPVEPAGLVIKAGGQEEIVPFICSPEPANLGGLG